MRGRWLLAGGMLSVALGTRLAMADCREVFARDEKVMVLREGKWVEAAVKKRQDDQYQILLVGKAAGAEEWTSSCRMEKAASYGKTWRTSPRNSRAHKLEAEAAYLCRKDLDRAQGVEDPTAAPPRGGIKATAPPPETVELVESCIRARLANTGVRKPGPIARFTPGKAQEFAIHQACLGGSHRFCADKCDEFKEAACLPQCLEQVEACRDSFAHDVAVHRACNGGGAATWMPSYDRLYEQGGASIWLVPSLDLDTSRDAGLEACAAPFARLRNARRQCLEAERCLAVCQVEPTSQPGAADEATCKVRCKRAFPRCKAPVTYPY